MLWMKSRFSHSIFLRYDSKDVENLFFHRENFNVEAIGSRLKKWFMLKHDSLWKTLRSPSDELIC